MLTVLMSYIAVFWLYQNGGIFKTISFHLKMDKSYPYLEGHELISWTYYYN